MCRVIPIILGLACIVGAEDTPEDSRDAERVYGVFREPHRTSLVRERDRQIQDLENLQALLERKLADVGDDETRASLDKRRTEVREELERLKRNQPPFVAMDLSRIRTFGPRWADQQDVWKVGDFGVSRHGARVIRVLSEDRVLLDSKSLLGPNLFLLSEFPTTGMEPGAHVSLDEPVFISGTETYRPDPGGQVEVLVLKPFDWDRAVEHHSLKRRHD